MKKLETLIIYLLPYVHPFYYYSKRFFLKFNLLGIFTKYELCFWLILPLSGLCFTLYFFNLSTELNNLQNSVALSTQTINLLEKTMVTLESIDYLGQTAIRQSTPDPLLDDPLMVIAMLTGIMMREIGSLLADQFVIFMLIQIGTK